MENLKFIMIMSKKENFYENEEFTITNEDTPIFIPSEIFFEGYLESSKSIKLECSLQEPFFLQKNC